MADIWVIHSQEWINKNFASVSGIDKIVEDGIPGWDTMYALTRALQHELGISALSNNFGAGTEAAYQSKVGSISASTNAKIVGILQCALWCKGYTGGTSIGTWDDVITASLGNVRNDLGLVSGATIDAKLMKSMLTLDAYIRVGTGTETVRAGQQWLNSRYADRGDYYLVPCDGRFTRDVQRGLMLAIQYEIGMADGVANGNFGPGTQSGLKTQGVVKSGSSDGATKFVSLFQLALAFNGYEVARTGSFSAGTRTSTLDFQRFMEISATGDGDYDTWAALLVSTGNPDRPVTGMDTTTTMTPELAALRYKEGYRVIGRYLTVTGKAIGPGELDVIFDAGFKLVPIFQNHNNRPEYFTHALGLDHGQQAAIRARQLGLKAGVTIFFAVDYDAVGTEIAKLVVPYFEGIAEGLGSSVSVPYKIGGYGTRNVTAVLFKAGKISAVWVSGMSTGYSGNLGFPMPEGWWYNQIQEITSINVDRNAVSVRASPAGRVDIAQTPDLDAKTKGFFWAMTKQVVLAEGTTRASALIAPQMASEFVLSYLMSVRYASGPWLIYTPLPESNIVGGSANVALAAARRDYFAAAGSLADITTTYDGDLEHMAATAQGVLQWGSGEGSPRNTTGDLGGWALDLVTFWKCFRKSGSRDLSDFVKKNLGVATSEAEFAMDDVIADADGWLVARSLASGARLDDVVGVLLRNHPTWQSRLAEFLRLRFGSKSTLVSAITSVFSDPWHSASGFARDHFLDHETGPDSGELATLADLAATRLYDLAASSL